MRRTASEVLRSLEMRVARLERNRGMGRRASGKDFLHIGLAMPDDGFGGELEIVISAEDASFYPEYRWEPADNAPGAVLTSVKGNDKAVSLGAKMGDRDTMTISEREAVAILGRKFSGHSEYLVYWRY